MTDNSGQYLKKERAKKDSVSIESVNGMLRLRWRCPTLGRQRSKSLELEDTPINRSVA